MDQYAHVLLERIEGSVMVEEAGAVGPAVTPAGVAVLAPSRWMRAADVLPHTWEATSDSVAAFVAGALDAARLVLIKPVAGTDDLVDECFHAVLPAGMPCKFSTGRPWTNCRVSSPVGDSATQLAAGTLLLLADALGTDASLVMSWANSSAHTGRLNR